MINVSTRAIEALKSDTRFIKAHLDIYFTSVPTRFDNYFMSLDISEQNNSGDTPFGNVVYNELTVTLDNIDGTFLVTNLLSPYYNKLVSGIKVEVTYEVEVEEDIFETIKGGTFYTADWKSNTSNSTAILTCYDLLFKYNTEKPITVKPYKNIMTRDAFAILFKAAGLEIGDYIIDNNLYDILPVYWTNSKRFSEELADLAVTACANVFVDKNNKIRVQSLLSNEETNLVISDDDLIMSTKDEDSYSNIYDSIKIEYTKINKISSSTVYSEDITVTNGTQILTGLALNECPVTDIVSIIIIGASTVTVPSYVYDSAGLTITLTNSGDTCKVKLVIVGETLTHENVIYTKQSDVSTRNNVLELKLPLAQNEEYVKRFANNVLSMYSQYTNSIEIDIRALPILEINDRVLITSGLAQLNNRYIITGIDSTFENGLIGKITVRAANKNKGKQYAYLGPGMYIELKE